MLHLYFILTVLSKRNYWGGAYRCSTRYISSRWRLS